MPSGRAWTPQSPTPTPCRLSPPPTGKAPTPGRSMPSRGRRPRAFSQALITKTGRSPSGRSAPPPAPRRQRCLLCSPTSPACPTPTRSPPTARNRAGTTPATLTTSPPTRCCTLTACCRCSAAMTRTLPMARCLAPGNGTGRLSPGTSSEILYVRLLCATWYAHVGEVSSAALQAAPRWTLRAWTCRARRCSTRCFAPAPRSRRSIFRAGTLRVWRTSRACLRAARRCASSTWRALTPPVRSTCRGCSQAARP